MAPARATIFPAQGGQGDAAEEYRCPQGYVLVGFVGRTGTWIDQVGLMCSQVLAGYATGGVVAPPAKGGNGGTPNEQYCERDAAIRAIALKILYHRAGMTEKVFNSGTQAYRWEYVQTITFSCIRPKDGSPAQPHELSGSGRLLGNDLNMKDGTDVPDLNQTCPGNEYATGLNIRYGKHVNAVGLICGTIAPPVIQVVNPPGLLNPKPHAPSSPATTPAADFSHSANVVLSHLPPAGEPGGVAGPAPTMTGTFDTDLGVLVLTAAGGTYSTLDGRVTVTNVAGDFMDGTWTTSWSAQRCADGQYRGRFHFRFTQAGFIGTYGLCDGPITAGQWNGKRR